MEALGPLTLLPALVAISLAFWTRHVVISLGIAAWLGATLLAGWDPLTGLYDTFDTLIIDAISDRDHVKVTLFSLLVAGTVEVMNKGRGTEALVALLLRLARSRRSGMLAAWAAGLAVFFDDYANCLIVGASMRPLADRLRISREKLAYIVDSTAAPIASVALVSTWIGYEVSLMADGLEAAGLHADAYAFFVEGIGYRSYSLFTIAFVGAVAWTGRDFGPMRAAEARAARGGAGDREALEPPTALRVALGVLPVITLVAVTFGYLLIEGRQGLPADARLFEILGNADGYDAMVRASLVSVLLAITLAAAGGSLGLKEGVDAAMKGMLGLFEAIVILVLAWSLGAVMGELDAAGYLVELLQGALSAWALPTLVFVVAAATSFATGTSFGTMAILVPIALPLAVAIAPDDAVIHLAASSAVLTGACWGDHCSPISDTTVLSSAGAGCELVAHVRTQLPYAVACGLISIVFGTLPAGFGVPLVITIPLGVAACWITLRALGRPPSTPSGSAPSDRTSAGPSSRPGAA